MTETTTGAATDADLAEVGRAISTRNMTKLQSIHDHVVDMGAACPPAESPTGDGVGTMMGEAAARLPDDLVLSEAQLAALTYAVSERNIPQSAREKMPAADFAGPNQSFPIAKPEDVAAAAHLVGKAADSEAVKRKIMAIARRKGAAFLAKLPAAWTEGDGKTSEAAAAELSGDIVPLVEAKAAKDGTFPIRIIAPGWGSSGYYSPALLERDGPSVFAKGLQMYWDHPTSTEESERPERSLRDLAGTLTSDAHWDADGPAGPGLYADAQVVAPYVEALEQLAPHIGVSIRATGKASMGEADGRTGQLIEQLVAAKSVDFVTQPGAGGKVLSLFEAARTRADIPAKEQVQVMEDKALQEAQTKIAGLETEMARLREAALVEQARRLAAETVGRTELPDVTKARLVESLAQRPATKDGALDAAAFATRVAEAVKAEAAYLAKATGSGTIRGMGADAGATEDTAIAEAAQTRLEESFGRLGLSEAVTKVAARGR